MYFHKLRIRISLLWLPYLLMLSHLSVARLTGQIFIMFTIHKMAHMLRAIFFHYPAERISIYPFGLMAAITHIGHGSLVKEILIISAGPLMHILFLSLFQFCVARGILSPSFASYLHTINTSILLFNLLPTYPLDGGRFMQTFFHYSLRFRTAEYAILICSLISIAVVFYFHLLQGVSAVIVLISLILQIFLSWRSFLLAQLQFFHYRRLHPVAYDPILSESFNLYRGRRSIIKYGRGWIDEKDWLRQCFGGEENSRHPQRGMIYSKGMRYPCGRYCKDYCTTGTCNGIMGRKGGRIYEDKVISCICSSAISCQRL